MPDSHAVSAEETDIFLRLGISILVRNTCGGRDMPRKKLFLLCATIPVAIWAVIFIIAGIFPFGDKTLAYQDAYLQYVPFARLAEGFVGQGYSMRCGLGFETVPLAAYYCMSPSNILYAIIPADPYVICGFIAVAKSSLTCMACSFCFTKKHGKSDIWIFSLSLAYTFCGFIANQFSSFIWTDAFMLFPLIFYFFSEYMEKDNRKSLISYSSLMFIAIWSNFYMAYGICLFVIILFFFYFKHDGIKGMAKKGIRVLIHSLVPVALNGYMLIKTIGYLLSQPGNGTQGIYSFTFADIFKSFLTGNSEAIPSPGYIYLSMTGFMAICLFAGIAGRKYRHAGKLRFFFALVFTVALISPLNLLFHGGDEPNFFFNRYAYLFVFMFLYLLYDMVGHISRKQFDIGLAVFCLFTAAATVLKASGTESYGWVQMPVVYVTWMFAALYAVAFFIKGYKKYIPFIMVAELLVGMAFITMSKEFPQIPEAEWNGATEFRRVDSIKENGSAYTGTGERINFFSSTICQNLSKFFYCLCRASGNTDMAYSPYNYFMASMLGQFGITDGDEVMDREGFEDDGSGILKYRYPLSVGFIVGNSLKGMSLPEDTEKANNILFETMTGVEKSLVSRPAMDKSKTEGSFSFTFTEDYPRIITTVSDRIDSVRKNGEDIRVDTDNLMFFCFMDIKKGDCITFDVKKDVRFDFLSFHTGVFEEGYKILKEKQFETDEYSDTYISGEIYAENPSCVFFSIAWNKRWKAYVDGKKTEIIPACGVLSQVNVPAGRHRIELKWE